jgi:Ras GTPase-activating-like protein IQGAP2/3
MHKKGYATFCTGTLAELISWLRKKRLTIPFTTQFFHERSLAKKGMQPKFGSYVYSAAKLYVIRL